MVTEWAYFVLAWLPVCVPDPFEASATIMSEDWSDRIIASKPSSCLDAQLLRWRIAASCQCMVFLEVVHSPIDDPFQAGLD
jgi:hypothetical protein